MSDVSEELDLSQFLIVKPSGTLGFNTSITNAVLDRAELGGGMKSVLGFEPLNSGTLTTNYVPDNE
jgi:hypothetical protein